VTEANGSIIEGRYPSPDVAIAVFRGDHDYRASSRDGSFLFDLIDRHQVVVADLRGATYIDSSILQCLLLAKREATERGVAFKLQTSLGTPIAKMLALTGLTDHFEQFEPSIL